MSTVYISIGTPKTGTTALQTFLRENENELNKQGYCYPMLELGIAPYYADRNGPFLAMGVGVAGLQGCRPRTRRRVTRQMDVALLAQ